MTNEEQDIDLLNNEPVEVEVTEGEQPEVEETETETETQFKQTETLEAKRARLQRQLNQVNKKLGVNDEPVEQPKSQKVDNQFDYGQKAFLIALGIKSKEEIDLAKKLQKETGKDLDSLIETNYFKTELKALRDSQDVNDAIPKNSKRSGQSSVNTVEYWLAKGELPPADQVELRRAVVNAEIERDRKR